MIITGELIPDGFGHGDLKVKYFCIEKCDYKI
jgi:hypothetical protein